MLRTHYKIEYSKTSSADYHNDKIRLPKDDKKSTDLTEFSVCGEKLGKLEIKGYFDCNDNEEIVNICISFCGDSKLITYNLPQYAIDEINNKKCKKLAFDVKTYDDRLSTYCIGTCERYH